MKRGFLIAALALVFPLLLPAQVRDDQFKRDAFSQNYADSTDQAQRDSSQLFNFREYFGGLAHKRSSSLKTLFMGSTVVIGGEQIYNRQYAKLPAVYGGIGAGIGLGIHFNVQYHETGEDKYKQYRNYAYGAAGLFYWATLLDGVYNYPSNRTPDPAKSTLYSLLLPGLGQLYNGEFWKVPLYWGLIGGGIYFYSNNSRNYHRYKNIYDLATSEDPTVEKPPIPAQTALYYRDVFRRYRDYSVLATAVFYLLQVIDADVFAYMQGFEVSDDIALRVRPALIDTPYAMTPAMGMRIGLRF